ncbi:condensation domain-containing protein [Merismopedia glauca]|uniref:Condensation protein n=1 Tax=Merismopedia glauca CCAP 1448/3 TaxID=1296344 RepID=A0A2T1C2R2_9CYAN|nr:condensation domain-containing protein [Merismopedia glauca]PSB02437.1 condensation protein [Merismopedia glauca CCAP 1448/3]
MQLKELLAELSGKGVQLWVEGEQLRVRAPKDAINADLKEFLANNKAELIEWLRSPQISDNSIRLLPIPRTGNLPLSFGQERLWWLSQLAPSSSVYNIPVAFHLAGKLDIAALESSFAEIVHRHEVLRTSFPIEDGKPQHAIAPHLPIQLPVTDLQSTPLKQREQVIQNLVTQAAREPFDLASQPLWRIKLLQLGVEEYVLFLVIHHTIFDGWSFKVLFRELNSLYTSFYSHKAPELTELAIQYADYASWQRQYLQGNVLESLLTYWKQQLDGTISPLDLPIDKHILITSDRGASQSVELSPHLTDAVKELSREAGCSLFMTFLAAFQTLIYRYTGHSEIITCSPLACRQQSETEGLIGYLNNLVPLRIDISGNPSFKELLLRVRRVALGAYAHQDLPFQKLLELPNLGHAKLTQTMFSLLSEEHLSLQLPGIVVQPIEVHNGTANFDLSLSIWEKGETLKAALEYKTDLFSASTIIQMLDNFQILLAAIVKNPEQNLSSLPLFTKKDTRTVPQPNSAPFLAPRDALECQIAKIWEEVLDIKPIGVRDNLFALGANSLLAVRLGDHLQQVLHKSIPLATIFQATTIEQLAAILSQEEYALSESSIAGIQPLGSNPPLFLFEGVGIYYPLVPHLGLEQPIYGLVGELGKGKLSQCDTIEDLAAYYLAEIQTIQPKGPYFLGGVSWGGVVALEIAQQLAAKGEKVGLLALLDTIRPSSRKHLPIAKRLQYHYRQLTQAGFSHILQKVNNRFKKLKKKFSLVYDKLGLEHELVASTNVARLAMRDAYNQAAMKYIPQVYPGKITIFAASDRSESIGEEVTPDLGWGNIAEQGVEIHQIPGDHLGILQEPHVQILAEKLKSCLEAQKLVKK